jgi:hypothetical protein
MIPQPEADKLTRRLKSRVSVVASAASVTEATASLSVAGLFFRSALYCVHTFANG